MATTCRALHKILSVVSELVKEREKEKKLPTFIVWQYFYLLKIFLCYVSLYML